MTESFTRITLITGNTGKAIELGQLLGVHVNARRVPLPEVQALSVEDVVGQKASAAYSSVGGPVIVDDSGIIFDAWSGLPGALTSWFMDTVGNEGLLRMLEGWPTRAASVVTALGFCDGNEPIVVLGRVTGQVSSEPRGSNGFGYDSIFIPSGASKTFAEMTQEEKNGVSMRARAAKELRHALDARGFLR